MSSSPLIHLPAATFSAGGIAGPPRKLLMARATLTFLVTLKNYEKFKIGDY
jgi:hypothetical protein